MNEKLKYSEYFAKRSSQHECARPHLCQVKYFHNLHHETIRLSAVNIKNHTFKQLSIATQSKFHSRIQNELPTK